MRFKPLYLGKKTGGQFYGDVIFGSNVILGNHVILGYPKEARIRNEKKVVGKTQDTLRAKLPLTKIGNNSLLGNFVVVGEGSQIGNGVFIEDFCRIGFNCIVGNNSRIMYGAFICDRVSMGENARIAGFICDGAEIGNNSTVMGSLVHEYTQPYLEWGQEEGPPQIGNNSVVGFGAVVIGRVKIADNSYIAAGAIVTKDVQTRSIVIGVNQAIPFNQWRGKKLSPSFWDWKIRK